MNAHQGIPRVDHYYVFRRSQENPDDLYHDRTSSAQGAADRIRELERRGIQTLYLQNCLPARWFY